eukprot:scaffold48306_cov52-Phaeocystis_antarctica.AAC.3
MAAGGAVVSTGSVHAGKMESAFVVRPPGSCTLSSGCRMVTRGAGCQRESSAPKYHGAVWSNACNECHRSRVGVTTQSSSASSIHRQCQPSRCAVSFAIRGAATRRRGNRLPSPALSVCHASSGRWQKGPTSDMITCLKRVRKAWLTSQAMNTRPGVVAVTRRKSSRHPKAIRKAAAATRWPWGSELTLSQTQPARVASRCAQASARVARKSPNTAREGTHLVWNAFRTRRIGEDQIKHTV